MCSGAFLAQKWLFSGPKLQFLKLRCATCESRSRPPPLSFLLKLCVIVLHTHRYHSSKFHLNPKHQDRVLIFTHFACAAACLLLACCLFAATKPGRSTLDTKKGRKTKTGSTNSVTLTLTCGHVWSQNGHVQGSFGLGWGQNCSKCAQNRPISLVCAPQMVQDFFWKTCFFTRFGTQNSRFSRHFVTLEGPQWLKMG